jgi:crotonobetainyl-CoA:carnitine CoA-transferase CaiB-like acyl-CoA transferase
MTLPLEGIRILAVTQYGAGPFGMLQLADLGADIIKIENPGSKGDVGRTVPPYLEEGVNDSIYFQSFNRNNRSVTLNLVNPKGVEVFHRLTKSCHGVFSNLRGDLPTRMGLRYKDLKAINPKIVTCHLTGYGMDNSRSASPSYDMLIQGETGWMDITGEPGGAPQRSGVPVVDFAGGYNAAFALVSGILRAQISGKGCDLDVSLYDTAVAMLNYMGTWHLTRAHDVMRQPGSSHPSQVPSGVFKTSDGWIVYTCAKEEFFARLSDIVGRPEWKEDPRFLRFADRLKNREVLVPMLQDLFVEKTTGEWLDLMGPDFPAARVNTVATALAEPFLEERQLMHTMEHPVFGTVRTLGSPVKADSPRIKAAIAPPLGAHTDEVLTSLAGYSLDEVEALRREGAV